MQKNRCTYSSITRSELYLSIGVEPASTSCRKTVMIFQTYSSFSGFVQLTLDGQVYFHYRRLAPLEARLCWQSVIGSLGCEPSLTLHDKEAT